MIVIAKFVLWLLSLLPAGAPYWLGMGGARLWMRFSPVKRHTTQRNLERCFPDLSEERRAELARDSFGHYLASVLETGHNWYWPVEKLAAQCDDMVNRELFEQALASGRGVVVLAPHFGAWEYLGMYLQKYPDIAILYKPPANPGLEKALLHRRRRGGGTLIAATPTGIRQLFAHIRAGHAAGVLPDQQPSRGQGRFVPFFGHAALTGVLAPRLIQRTGCQAVACACERLPRGRYRVHVLPVDDAIHDPDLDVALAAVNRAVEDCIAIDPAQYLWSYRRFKKRPEGEPPFYDFK
ncbi:MAG: lysophospholipid acyltransferase family protein [Xanthomonadales bacterium]